MKKLRKSLRRAFSVLAMAALCVIYMGQAAVFAAETEDMDTEKSNTVMETQEITSGKIINQNGGDASINALGTPNGEVVGSGVRLRSKPSLSAPILELMYYGDEVSIVVSKTTTNSDGVWYFVLHIDSNTWGYASANYIFCWDI